MDVFRTKKGKPGERGEPGEPGTRGGGRGGSGGRGGRGGETVTFVVSRRVMAVAIGLMVIMTGLTATGTGILMQEARKHDRDRLAADARDERQRRALAKTVKIRSADQARQHKIIIACLRNPNECDGNLIDESVAQVRTELEQVSPTPKPNPKPNPKPKPGDGGDVPPTQPPSSPDPNPEPVPPPTPSPSPSPKLTCLPEPVGCF